MVNNIKESENDKINAVTKRYSSKRKSINYVKKNSFALGSNDKLNINNINDINQITIEDIGESKKIKSHIKKKGKGIKLKKFNTYALILRNANNEINPVPYQSDYIINNFVYDEAIIYEDRSYCRIFFIILISKENVLNMIFFNPPLEFKHIRIAIFIFNFACDYALNALFYLSDNISDRYHYEGIYRELYSLVNNLTISLTSTIVSFVLLFFFNTLTISTSKIEKLFRTQEELLKKDSKYKVNKETILEIRNEIKHIIKCLRIKIIIFIILEFLFLFFFFYYTTAFCHVYKKTQVSWILDCIMSYAISLVVALGISFVFALVYKLSVRYKKKFLYKITTLFCIINLKIK